MKSYNQIYQGYCNHYYHYLENQYSWYRKAESLRDAITKAFHSEDELGKVDNHQRLVGRQRLALAAEIALEYFDTKCIQNSDNFHSIYQFVESVSHQVKGFGQLATYDVALRIAKYLNLELQEVYLHAGVTVGTRALGLKVKNGDILPVNAFPAPFNQLSGDHLENLLCIYKDVLANSANDVGKTCIRPQLIPACVGKNRCA